MGSTNLLMRRFNSAIVVVENVVVKFEMLKKFCIFCVGASVEAKRLLLDPGRTARDGEKSRSHSTPPK